MHIMLIAETDARLGVMVSAVNSNLPRDFNPTWVIYYIKNLGYVASLQTNSNTSELPNLPSKAFLDTTH